MRSDEIFLKVSKVLRSCDDLFFPLLARVESHRLDIDEFLVFFYFSPLSSRSRSFNRKKLSMEKSFFDVKGLSIVSSWRRGHQKVQLVLCAIEIWKNVRYSCAHKKIEITKIYSCDDDR
jgi:hypothetical protein